MNAPLSATVQSTFTSAVPVLPTTNMAQAIIFYEQLGFSVLHQQADYALLILTSVQTCNTIWSFLPRS